MQARTLFEYAVIRVVPRVEREEFLNVGVILYCRDQSFLGIRYYIDEGRFSCFSVDFDLEEINRSLQSFTRICNGDADAGPIAKLDPASRFRWLTAYRSTIIQTSRVHPGFCVDAGEKLADLHAKLVL